MFISEWWNSLEAVTQVFYCMAIPSTLLLLIQTVMMFIGIGDDSDFDAPDTELDGELDIDDPLGLDSLKVFTLKGIIAFFVVFSWVGIVMQKADAPIYLTFPVAIACGVLIMVLMAYLLRAVMRLRSDGNTDNRNAIGVAGKVHLTIPPERRGEGKVHIMLQGSLVERNAVTDGLEAIPTGAEVVVVGTSGQTDLVVKLK
ncbi:MAG: NfeD family protein [Clostridia bacterium]|nr:NfeD family protein [Clostridia bacterium]